MMDACAKWLVHSHPVGQVVFFRCLFAFLPIGFLVLHSGSLASLSTRRPVMHVLRGLVMVAAIFLFFHSLKYLLLAEATAIFFAAPLFMVALSVPLLGEPVQRKIGLAVIIGFAGVLIIMRPGDQIWRVEAFWALGAAFFYALAMIATRSLTRTETVVSIVVHGNIAAVLLGAASLPFGWITPTLNEMAVFVVMGLCGGISTLFFVKACRYTRVSILAPFEYTALVWAAVLGFLLWRELPDAWIWTGSAIVVTMGLYVWRNQIGQNRGIQTGSSNNGEFATPGARILKVRSARRAPIGRRLAVK